MAQVPECVVCLQPYDDYLHVPRVLACGHSFCELCLMQLQSAWQPSPVSSRDSQASGALIRCPECSHRTKLPVGGQQYLPKNVELLRLLPSLMKEADSTEGKSETVQNPGGRRGSEGKMNNRLAIRRELAEDCVGRKTGERRFKGKDKERIDSNCTSSGTSPSNINNWLLPCDLYSDNVNRDVRPWILPDRAIKLREDCAGIKPVNNFERELLCGELILEQDRLSSSIPVTLLELEFSFPKENCSKEKLSYEQLVLKAWEGFQYDVQTELLILFRISLVCRRLCKVFGLWLNERNNLFLVSEIPTHDSALAWEMVIKSCQREELPCTESKDLNGNLKTDTKDSVRDNIIGSLSTSRMSDLKTPAEIVSWAVTTQTLARVGLGLCEALLEVHSQGVIFGVVSPYCFVLDQFDNLLLHLNAALNARFSVHEATTSYRKFCGTEFSLGHSSSKVQEKLDLRYSRNCWQYMCPEVLCLLVNNLADLEGPRTEENRTAMLQGCISCKADVWSLGCLLLELVSGKAPFSGLQFSEVLEKVLVEREKPEDLLSLDKSLEHGADDHLCMDIEKHGHIKVFKKLLSKCFAFDPDERPEVDALWLTLMELGSSNLISKGTFTKHLRSELDGSADQKYWIICLPGFVLDGFLDSRHEKKAKLQESENLHDKNAELLESERRLELLRLDSVTQDDGRELQPCGLELTGSLEGHQDYITALVICGPDCMAADVIWCIFRDAGDHLLSASFDKAIRVWSLEGHLLEQTLEGHSQVVVALAVDQNTSTCFSGDNGGKICAWSLGEHRLEPLIASWQEHDDWRYTGVASLAVSADGVLYSGSGDRTIKAWSLQNFILIGTMEGHKSLVSALLVDGELLYSGSWDGTIRVWWRSDHSPVAVLGGGAALVPSLGGVRTMCMSDSFLFAGRDNGAIQVWRDEECLTTVKAHDTVVSTLCVEGDFLYTGSWDQQIKAWRVDEFLSDPSPTLVKDCGCALSSIASDGDRLYAGLAERAIKVYSLLGDTWASLLRMLNP